MNNTISSDIAFISRNIEIDMTKYIYDKCNLY